MTATIHNVMDFNNLGVTLLESSDIYQARAFFSVAIDQMKRILDEEMIREKKNSIRTASKPELSRAMETSVSLPSLANSSLPHHDFLRPIYFSQDIVESKDPPLVKLSTSLLFNLALSNHAIAVQEVSPASSSTTEDAIFLYQLAYCLQNADGVELSWLHTMGMINNVGRLLAFVGVVDDAQQCFRHLLKQLLVRVDNLSRGGAGTRLGDNGHIEGFIDNVLHMVLRNKESSPAA